MAHWSSGQDASLSRWKLGFDSRMGHHKRKTLKRASFFFCGDPSHISDHVATATGSRKFCAFVGAARRQTDVLKGYQAKLDGASEGCDCNV